MRQVGGVSGGAAAVVTTRCHVCGNEYAIIIVVVLLYGPVGMQTPDRASSMLRSLAQPRDHSFKRSNELIFPCRLRPIAAGL